MEPVTLLKKVAPDAARMIRIYAHVTTVTLNFSFWPEVKILL